MPRKAGRKTPKANSSLRQRADISFGLKEKGGPNRSIQEFWGRHSICLGREEKKGLWGGRSGSALKHLM